LQKPPEQQYPQVAINITQEGMLFSLILGPGTSLNQLIPSEQVDQICDQWKKTRKQKLEVVRNMDAVRSINSKGKV